MLVIISGSKAYGADTPQSDIGIRGVFVWPEEVFYGFAPPPQVSDTKYDIIYYKLSRFTELLVKNNPNVLELFFMLEECIRLQHPLFAKLTSNLVMSKRCRDTFAGYAMGQRRKVCGFKKKIVNAM